VPWKNGRYVPRLRPESSQLAASTNTIPFPEDVAESDIPDDLFTESVLSRVVTAGAFTASFLKRAMPSAVFSVKNGMRGLFASGFVGSDMIEDGSITGSKMINPIKVSLIDGGAAGNHTVAGIKITDELISVLEQNGTSGLLADLTTEFSIKKADTIDNTGGTATSSDKLLVLYLSK
tara:strand:- start:713 stop:1243 length:531 start_codon:yes stop_codon:yes gene_type:complete